MLLQIDFDSEVPFYQQIRDQVVEAIAVGELRAGDSLPASRTLAADLAINFHTVVKAYDLLRREGLLLLNRKTGAVVARDPSSGPPPAGFVDQWSVQLRAVLADARAHGVPPAEVHGVAAQILTSLTGDASSPRRTQ